MLNEEEVYNGTKRFLRKNGFTLLAGQPPRGVDHLPVVQIKSGLNQEKGSKDASKPDLVAFNDKCILIIECKPDFNTDDINKLHDILDSELRLQAFYSELKERNLLHKIKPAINFETFCSMIAGSIAYSSDKITLTNTFSTHASETPETYTSIAPINRLFQIVVSNWQGEGTLIFPKK